MNRLPDLTPEELEPDQRALLEEIQSTRGRVGLVGPFGIWVRHPDVGRAIQAVGAAVRFGKLLPDDVKEVAICTVGAHFKAKFEFAAHKRLAAQAGVPAEVIEAIEASEAVVCENAALELCHQLTSELLNECRVAQETYDEAVQTWGERGMIELASLVGYYCLVSMTLNLFETPLAPGMEDPFPDLP